MIESKTRIVCDSHMCERQLVLDTRKAFEVRRYAESRGWLNDAGAHYCPRCKDQ